MKLILHIGTHKTGTTAIQKFLLGNTKALCKTGVLYPVSCLDKSKSQYSYLATLLRNGKLTKVKRDLKLIREEAAANDCHTVVLSGEDFSTLNHKHVGVFRDLVEGFNVEVKVYFRNVYDFLISAFSEINKTSAALAKVDRLNRQLSRLVDYDRTLHSWCSAFGEEAVDVYSYDRVKQEIIPHFLKSISIEQSVVERLTCEKVMTSYSEINSRFDPLASFLLVAFGKIKSSQDYDVAKDTWGQVFSGNNSSDELLHFVAVKYIQAKGVAYRHPKLRPVIEDILSKRDVDLQKVFASFDSGDYMVELGNFLITMGKGKGGGLRRSRFSKLFG